MYEKGYISEVYMAGKIGQITLWSLVVLLGVPTAWAERGRIYGKIHTTRGDTLVGIIRWDKNESSWDDLIDGEKERDVTKVEAKAKRKKYADKDNEVSIFGWHFSSGDNGDWGSMSESAISFGHIKKLTPVSDDGADLLLKSGKTVTITNSSTDLGSGIRELRCGDGPVGALRSRRGRRRARCRDHAGRGVRAGGARPDLGRRGPAVHPSN